MRRAFLPFSDPLSCVYVLFVLYAVCKRGDRPRLNRRRALDAPLPQRLSKICIVPVRFCTPSAGLFERYLKCDSFAVSPTLYTDCPMDSVVQVQFSQTFEKTVVVEFGFSNPFDVPNKNSGPI